MQGRYPVVILNANGLEWSAGHAQMLLMSAHYPCEHPNRDNDDQDLFDALGLVSGVLSRSDRMRVAVGLDANVKLPVSVSEPMVCANSPHARQLTDRRALLFEQLLQTHSARVLVDPSLPAEELVTHRHWRTQRLSMMDYIIDTARARAPEKSWVDYWCADSDHRPVVVCLESCHVSPKFHKRRPKNWTCNAPLDFNHQIAESCQAASDFGLDALTKAVSEAAREHGTSQRLVLKDSPDDEALLRALNTALRLEVRPEIRRCLQKRIWRLRRRARRNRKKHLAIQCARQGTTREYLRLTTKPRPPQTLDGVSDRSLWLGMLTDHFKSIFRVSDPDVDEWQAKFCASTVPSCSVTASCVLQGRRVIFPGSRVTRCFWASSL